MTYEDMAANIYSAAEELEIAQVALERAVKDYAETERLYKMGRSTAYVATSGTVAEREAVVDQSISTLRYEAHLKEGLKVAALEAVRNRRAILSALQTLANLSKSEADFARTGPSYAT